MTPCSYQPTEGTPCPLPATRTVTYKLRHTGWTRSCPYCLIHARKALAQGGIDDGPAAEGELPIAYRTTRTGHNLTS